MAFRNLVQIADDVADMSVAQIRSNIENQEHSNIPIWVLTAALDSKLKNLETARAQEAAAQNVSQPPTVVAGLMNAVGNIPTERPNTTADLTTPAPLSEIGASAVAAPHRPNPAIQALMTQNQNQPAMPTVRAVRGYHPPVMYPGASMGSTDTITPRLSPEMWAKLTAARQKRGVPPLRGEGEAAFEKTYREGAAPRSLAAFGGILSELASIERDRVHGGSDTMAAAHGGPVRNLPTVRMQGVKTIDDVIAEIEAGVTREPAFTDPGWEGKEFMGWEGIGQRDEGQPLEAILGEFGEGAVLHTAEQQAESQLQAQRQAEALARSRLWEDEASYMDGHGAGGIDPEVYRPSIWDEERAGGMDPEVTGLGVDVSAGDLEHAIRQAKALSETQKPPEATMLDFGDADILDLNIAGQQNVDGTELPAVPSLTDLVTEREKLAPDYSERKEAINVQARKDLKTFEEQEVVPQSVKDIRDHVAKSIEALERSPVPWMRAAAAATKGHQPLFLALTNAMIGYTEGTEELRKEGLETMGQLADMDMQMAALEAQRAADVFAQKQLITQAQRAEVQGDEDKAAKYIASASAARDAALGRNIDIERINAQIYVAHMNMFGTDRAAAQDVLKALFKEHKNDPEWFTIATDGTATPTAHSYKIAYETVDPKALNFAALQYGMSVQGRNLQLTNLAQGERDAAASWADEEIANQWLAAESPFKEWLITKGITIPEGTANTSPKIKGLLEAFYLETESAHYRSTPEIRAQLDPMYPGVLGGQAFDVSEWSVETMPTKPE